LHNSKIRFCMWSKSRRLGLLTKGLAKVFSLKHQAQQPRLPTSSDVLASYLRHRGYPHWTAFYVPYCQAENDLFGRSHFNFSVDDTNYHVLRTGAFPFIKFHCTRRPVEDLAIEDWFYRFLKCLNFGLPTLVYGFAGLLWAKHTEQIAVRPGNQVVTLFFWYKEDRSGA